MNFQENSCIGKHDIGENIHRSSSKVLLIIDQNQIYIRTDKHSVWTGTEYKAV
jgi:hypothetical protein